MSSSIRGHLIGDVVFRNESNTSASASNYQGCRLVVYHHCLHVWCIFQMSCHWRLISPYFQTPRGTVFQRKRHLVKPFSYVPLRSHPVLSHVVVGRRASQGNCSLAGGFALGTTFGKDLFLPSHPGRSQNILRHRDWSKKDTESKYKLLK